MRFKNDKMENKVIEEYVVKNILEETVKCQIYEGVDQKTKRIFTLTLYENDLYMFQYKGETIYGVFDEIIEDVSEDGERFIAYVQSPEDNDDSTITYMYFPERKLLVYNESSDCEVAIEGDSKKYGL